MTREELLEYAALDAFGLLDEYESALFTRSFHNAPAAIQDRIVELQAQLVSDESLLPSENPGPALREKVLTAVASAIEHETAQLEPLATIGRRGMAPDVVGRISMGASGQVWRAAAFALCAGLIVVAYFLAQMSSQHNQIAALALQLNTAAQLEELIGPTFKDYVFEPNAQKVAFKDMTGASPAPRAVLLIKEGSNEAFLVVEGLALSAEPYLLKIKTAAGDREDVQKIESSGKLMGMHIALNRLSQRLKNATWEITTSTGDVLLASI